MSEQKNIAQFFAFSNNKVNNTPKFSEGKGEWIKYGDDNMYPNYLLDLMNNSSKHNAIVKRKTDLTAGGGWINENDFITNQYGDEDLNDIVYKSAYDLNIFGAFVLIGTWSKDRKSVARLQYVATQKVRIANNLDPKTVQGKRAEEGVEYFFISSDWSNAKKNPPKLIQGYSSEYRDEENFVVYQKEYRPGVEYYSLPDYISSIDWIELDKEIANFHLSSVHNGFTPSMIISFNNGIPTPEEQDIVYKQVQKRYAGTDNGSNVFITFSDGGDKTPTFTPVTLNDSDERFLMLEEHITQNITIGHRIPLQVAGVAIEGKLGSSAEISENEMLFQHQVIDAKQALIERCYNKLYMIGKENKDVPPLKLKKVKTFIEVEQIQTEENNGN